MWLETHKASPKLNVLVVVDSSIYGKPSVTFDFRIWQKGTNVQGNLRENKGIPGYSPMDAFKVPMENYIFLERWDPPLYTKYSAFYGDYEEIHKVVIRIFPVFPAC